MTTLTIKDLKTQKSEIVSFFSKDKLEKFLNKVITDEKEARTRKKGYYLEGYSYDTKSEKELIESFLPEERKLKGSQV